MRLTGQVNPFGEPPVDRTVRRLTPAAPLTSLLVVYDAKQRETAQRAAPSSMVVEAYFARLFAGTFGRVFYLPPRNDEERRYLAEHIETRRHPLGVVRPIGADLFPTAGSR